MTGIGVEDTLKAITKLVLNNLSSKYRLEEGLSPGAGPKAAPPPTAAKAEPPATLRAEAPSRNELPARTHRAAPPEDRALDALESEGAERQDDEDVIDLVDEVPAEEPAQLEPITLDDEILEEIEEEMPEVAARPSAVRQPMSRPPLQPVPAPGPRAIVASGALAVEADPLDLDEPIDLDVPLEDEYSEVAADLSAGPLRPDQEREIEVPLRVDLDGRTLTIQVRLKIRLS